MKTGIIIAYTGSPASTHPDDIERYLQQFLMDDRIRQMPKPFWKNLMFKHVLPKRKFSSAKRYEFIWQEYGSPLIHLQQSLADKVQATFDARNDDAIVRSAMSYGVPNIVDVLAELKSAGCERIVLLPLYPQSAYSPTQAVIDAYKRAVSAVNWNPPACIIDNYHDNPLYIKAIAQAIKQAGYGQRESDRLLLSFHAIPLKDERAGDTYRAQIAESRELIARELGIGADKITIGFQSVFGHNVNAWASPLSKDILPTWADDDCRVFYGCPGFAIDCLETLYDIPNEIVPALEGEEAGKPTATVADTKGDLQAAINSDRFVWLPTLNDSQTQVELACDVLDAHIDAGEFKPVKPL